MYVELPNSSFPNRRIKLWVSTPVAESLPPAGHYAIHTTHYDDTYFGRPLFFLIDQVDHDSPVCIFLRPAFLFREILGECGMGRHLTLRYSSRTQIGSTPYPPLERLWYRGTRACAHQATTSYVFPLPGFTITYYDVTRILSKKVAESS